MLIVACSDELTQPSDTSMAVAIDSVSPRASETGETVQLRILGTGFETGTTAIVEHSGAPSATVVVEKTDYMNEGELHVTVNIGADATPALYDIVVSNPDGTRAAAGGIFTVNLAVPIIVSEAVPSEAAQGEKRTIRIRGSGFLEGDEVAWERGGVVEEDVVVGQVEFISSEEMSVTIEVQEDAPVADYDVTVARPRKKGIGTEAFAVLPGIGSVLDAQFSFTYDGYRSDSFEVDDIFILDPATMNPGSWGLTSFDYEASEQGLYAHHLRADGLVDTMWCWIPGVRVRAPGTYALECWFIPQFNYETGEFPEEYTSIIGGDRPGDGSGTVTFTSVTPERLAGTFSITMHVVDVENWLSSPSITISDGKFDLPVVSSYWYESDGTAEPAPAEPPATGGASQAFGINDHGVIIGTAWNEFGARRAVRWTTGADGTLSGPEELGTLNGTTHQFLNAINNEGAVIGIGYNVLVIQELLGFIHDGTTQSLTRLEGALTGRAWGINDHGIIVGEGFFNSPGQPTDRRGAVWLDALDPDESPVQLPPLHADATNTYGRAINNAGVIAGYSTPGNADETGSVRWQLKADGTISNPEPIAIEVIDMNEAEDFLGYDPATSAATLMRGNSKGAQRYSLRADDAVVVRALNSPAADQPLKVVGYSGTTPMVWSVDAAGGTKRTDLDLPDGYIAGIAHDVNVEGWIVGIVHNGDDQDGVAVLWRPQPAETGYDIITLGTLAEPAGSGSIVFTAPSSCWPWPRRADRSMSCR